LTLGFYKAHPSDDINLPNKVPASPFPLTSGFTLGNSPAVIAIVDVAVTSWKMDVDLPQVCSRCLAK
jgi:hypothetical protein